MSQWVLSSVVTYPPGDELEHVPFSLKALFWGYGLGIYLFPEEPPTPQTARYAPHKNDHLWEFQNTIPESNSSQIEHGWFGSPVPFPFWDGFLTGGFGLPQELEPAMGTSSSWVFLDSPEKKSAVGLSLGAFDRFVGFTCWGKHHHQLFVCNSLFAISFWLLWVFVFHLSYPNAPCMFTHIYHTNVGKYIPYLEHIWSICVCYNTAPLNNNSKYFWNIPSIASTYGSPC